MILKLEEIIIRRFVVRAKRERCLEFVRSGHNRSKIFDELNSPALFDDRCITEIAGPDRATPDALVAKLRELGLGGRVYVMSANDDWDGKKFQMSYVVAQSMAQCVDTLGYCWKSGTAFYEWHHSGAAYFLRSR